MTRFSSFTREKYDAGPWILYERTDNPGLYFIGEEEGLGDGARIIAQGSLAACESVERLLEMLP